MKINIRFKGVLVVDVWRDETHGEQVVSLGHDVDGENAVKAKAHAARLMRAQLSQRGDDVHEVDAKLASISQPGAEPRHVNQVLTEVVYAMGERLHAPGEDVLDIELSTEQPETLN